MDDISGDSAGTMSDFDEHEEVSKLLNAETHFVEMDEVEKAAKEYLLHQKTEFVADDTSEGMGILKELQNEVIDEEDELQYENSKPQSVSPIFIICLNLSKILT